ncbi:MAG: cupin domain-containing protein [Gaiellaceae bacterium]
MSQRPNVFADETWELTAEKMGVRGRQVGEPAGAKELGAMIYEYEPGASGFNLHTHYGFEELFVVLSGRPTLRTPEGERPLETGDVVSCPKGRDGMHTFSNPTEEPVRILAISTLEFPDVVVYPELGTVAVATRHPFKPVGEGEDEGLVAVFPRDSDVRGRT